MATPEEVLAAWTERYADQSPEAVAAHARRQTQDDQWGPLEGPWGPAGSGGLVRTASGRSPEEASRQGPVPAAAPEPVDARPGRSPEDSPSAPSDGTPASANVRMDPTLLRRLAEELERQQQQQKPREELPYPPFFGQVGGPPPGYRPPIDETREQVEPSRLTLQRLLLEAPDLVRQAIPSSRARSMVIRALDDARLWFREALEELEAKQKQRHQQK